MSLAHLFPGVSCIAIVVDNAQSHNVTASAYANGRTHDVTRRPKCSRWESHPTKQNSLVGVARYSTSPTRRVSMDGADLTAFPKNPERRLVSRWESQPPLKTKTRSSLASLKKQPWQLEMDNVMSIQSCLSRKSWDRCPTLPSRLDPQPISAERCDSTLNCWGTNAA
jgi:hypothetical protein